ncbi:MULTISPECIES: hypothetical protein [Vibrio]|uniref:hypothetical protein n=1 Tax=Vibrio TaxID=662 RepID=UPI00168D7701|nr:MULTISPECIES: hypothetical protein [Vibrio]EHD0131858.1 hypothetical protein [Vibrio alginolyticus]MBO0150265.1 hypothetical protein [Vibrio sp. Vb2424]MCR9344558.1 hypothetical protein [Vibrio alginolyticus]MCR9418768.1 hypothetical protein [Vibrio alginolyticus]
MTEIELISFMTPSIALTVALAGGMIFLRDWRLSRQRESEYREQELKLRQLEIENSKGNRIHIENSNADTGADLGGYISIPIPEDRKSMFHDLLKGFEDYASLKGYKVNVSVDSSDIDIIRFKLVVNEFGVTASRESIKNDLQEYIERINSGSEIDDLPEILDPAAHARIVAAYKNRISFLQHNYNLEKNVRECYEKIVQNFPVQGIYHAQPIFNISNGNTDMDQRKYIANNSANVMQGDNHSNSLEHISVNIGSTFSETKEKLEGLEELISLIKAEPFAESEKAVRQLENVKDELVDEEEPDLGSIDKWLNKAGGLLKSAEKGSKLLDKAQSVMDSFGVTF